MLFGPEFPQQIAQHLATEIPVVVLVGSVTCSVNNYQRGCSRRLFYKPSHTRRGLLIVIFEGNLRRGDCRAMRKPSIAGRVNRQSETRCRTSPPGAHTCMLSNPGASNCFGKTDETSDCMRCTDDRAYGSGTASASPQLPELLD